MIEATGNEPARELIAMIDALATDYYGKHGNHPPIVFAFTPRGVSMLHAGQFGDKDELAAVMPGVLKGLEARSYVFAVEAFYRRFSASDANDRYLAKAALAGQVKVRHLAGRIDVISYMFERRTAGGECEQMIGMREVRPGKRRREAIAGELFFPIDRAALTDEARSTIEHGGLMTGWLR